MGASSCLERWPTEDLAPRRLRADPRFACAIIGLLRKARTEVCAAKSSDGPNPYFAHNIYI